MPRKREPNTTSARPDVISGVISGYSSGEYSRSASWIIIMSPVTAAKPRRSAAPLPPLRGWRSRMKPSSFCSRSRIAGVPSVDTSSTTISSMRILTARTRRMISSTVSCSLYTGITTESSGSAGTRCAARWSLEKGTLMRPVRGRGRPRTATARSAAPRAGRAAAPRAPPAARRAAPVPTCARSCR